MQPGLQIDPATLDAEQAYKLLVGVVVPRPIAWVTTISGAGVVNLAPFSAFTFVSPKPPMLAISVGRKGSVYKDTARNILASEEFVVHIADTSLIEPLHRSADEVPPDVSEVDLLGLETIASIRVRPPRLLRAPIAAECRLRHCIELGDTRSRLLIGEVVLFHFRGGLMQAGKIDTRALDPICRLGGPSYAALGETVTMAPVRQTSKA